MRVPFRRTSSPPEVVLDPERAAEQRRRVIELTDAEPGPAAAVEDEADAGARESESPGALDL